MLSLTTGLQPPATTSSSSQHSSAALVDHTYSRLNSSVAHQATMHSVLTISSPGFDHKQLPTYLCQNIEHVS